MSTKTELQAEFEAAKPGYGFAKLPSGDYLYEGVQVMFNDWLENNELRKANDRITELQAQLADAKKDAERYLKLRRMAVELSLSHQVISQLVTNQGELDAAIAEGKA